MANPKPPYEWTCQRCHCDNAPHTNLCATCGMTANFTAAQLAEFKTFEMRPVGFTTLEGLCVAGTAAGGGFLLWYFPSDSWVWFSPKLTLLVVGTVGVCCWLALKKAGEFIMDVTFRR